MKNKKHVNLLISESLHRRFKSKVARDKSFNGTMTQVIEDFIRKYLKEK